MKWYISWEHAEEYPDGLLWLEGDVIVSAPDLRTAMRYGMSECIRETPVNAVEIRSFSVQPHVEKQ